MKMQHQQRDCGDVFALEMGQPLCHCGGFVSCRLVLDQRNQNILVECRQHVGWWLGGSTHCLQLIPVRAEVVSVATSIPWATGRLAVVGAHVAKGASVRSWKCQPWERSHQAVGLDEQLLQWQWHGSHSDSSSSPMKVHEWWASADDYVSVWLEIVVWQCDFETRWQTSSTVCPVKCQKTLLQSSMGSLWLAGLLGKPSAIQVRNPWSSFMYICYHCLLNMTWCLICFLELWMIEITWLQSTANKWITLHLLCVIIVIIVYFIVIFESIQALYNINIYIYYMCLYMYRW